MSNDTTLDSTKSNEFQTPVAEVLERIRSIEGRIGLDPCWSPGCLTDPVTAIVHHAHVGHNALLRGLMASIASTTWIICDGLAVPWGGHGCVFVNPPYVDPRRNKKWRQAHVGALDNGLSLGGITPWVRKMRCDDTLGGSDSVYGLVPAYVGDGWFTWCWTADAICFLHGRLRHLVDGKPSKDSSRFSSCIPYWGQNIESFLRTFHGEPGTVWLHPFRQQYEPYRKLLHELTEKHERKLYVSIASIEDASASIEDAVLVETEGVDGAAS